MEARRQWNYVSKVLKKCKVRILYTTKYLSKETKWKHLHTHKSQRMFLKQVYTTGNDEKKNCSSGKGTDWLGKNEQQQKLCRYIKNIY